METTRSSARIQIRHPPPSPHAAPLLQPSSSTAALALSDPLSLPPPSFSVAPQTPWSSLSSFPVGIVVVGFMGRIPGDVTPLINHVLDSNVFGSGNIDKVFCIDDEEFRLWFQRRKISYYHDVERGILYVQYCTTKCPAIGRALDSHLNYDAALEEGDFSDVQGLLFMFSVCHVVVYIQEGSRFDSQILKKFRMLQIAKHALPLFSRTNQPSAIFSSPSSQPYVSVTTSDALHKTGGTFHRKFSSVSPMPGLSSFNALLPGQCTPVILFAFLDDFSDTVDPVTNIKDAIDSFTSNESFSSSSFTRLTPPTNCSSPIVVLPRPINRSEVGFRKKLLSSLEAQIRFLIKKSRTNQGSENNHAGSRNGSSSASPLFSLDASRCAVLLDRCTNKKGESLEFATGLVQDVLMGKSSSDCFFLESHGESATRDDIHSVREFIFRQSEILRGKGGMVSNSTSGSNAAIGMVAAAAAAAAASTASKKIFTLRELPSLETWLSSSQIIFRGLLSTKREDIDEIEMNKRNFRNAVLTSRVTEPLEVAVSLMDSAKELNTKFSTLWCQRVLPAAKEVYLNELPSCYPTSQHEVHLEKALRVFSSMVKGPSVQIFLKKLEEECISMWISGRQQCDAVSLTGNPCLHRKHDSIEGDSLSHSSGFMFLHACACGRSRKLRPDPFDFESANILFNHISDCDKHLPTVQLPSISFAGPIQTSSWSLVRVGDARYYDPSTGLHQSGFSITEKFLLNWNIFFEKLDNPPKSSDSNSQVLAFGLDSRPKVDLVENDGMGSVAVQLNIGEAQIGVENKKSPWKSIESGNKKVSLGKGFPKLTLKKQFSEVVAGSVATDLGYPPLHSRKKPSFDSEQIPKQNRIMDRSENSQGSKHPNNVASPHQNQNGLNLNGNKSAEPFLQIRNNACKIKPNTSSKYVTVYVGFEHECPHGHRFLLTSEHLNDLGPLYMLPEEAHTSLLISNSIPKPVDSKKLYKKANLVNVQRLSNGKNDTSVGRARNSVKSKEKVGNGLDGLEGTMQFGVRKEHDQASVTVSCLSAPEINVQEQLHSFNLDDGGSLFSMLNRNLPIYMSCPHCRVSKVKNESIKIKFANSISQLQRIFMVTPPFPAVLGTNPKIQFEASCLPTLCPDIDQQLQFSLGCEVILPPDSFVTLRLPFIYGVKLNDQSLHSLKPLQHHPQLTAWIHKGTTLRLLSQKKALTRDSQFV